VEPLAEGLSSRPVVIGKVLIDHGDQGSVGLIGFAEGPALQDANRHRLEVAVAYQGVEDGERLFATR